MAHHDLAQRVADALTIDEDVDSLMRELLEHVGDTGREARDYDVGVNVRLVIWPGWGPLDNPRDFVRISRPGS